MRFETHQLAQHYPLLFEGLRITLTICALSLAFGIVIGLVACFGKLRERGIAYRETGLIETYRDIINALREVSILAGKRTPA